MNNKKKTIFNSDNEFSCITEKPVYLGEAAYLKDQLKFQGIKSRIKIEESSLPTEDESPSRPPKDPVYSVWVPKKDSQKAREVVKTVVFDVQNTEIGQELPKPEKKRWFFKALAAGILGIMTGARIGIKMHNKSLYLVLVLGLGGLCFLAVWSFAKKN